MQGNPLNLNRVHLAQVATGMSPGDHPLGSLESRSIARALLDHAERTRPRPSDYDQDARTIYGHARDFLWADDLSPSFRDIQETPIYQHGREVAREEPTRQPIEDPIQDPISRLVAIFERAGLEPIPRDAKWREPLLFHMAYISVLQGFQAAWERQLASLPFPIKTTNEGGFTDVRLYLRRSSGEWTEETDESICRRVLGPVRELDELLGESLAPR